MLLALGLGIAAAQVPPPGGLIPPPAPAAAAQPNQRIYKLRADAPPTGEWVIRAISQTTEGPWRHLKGHAEMESTSMLFRADELDWNSDTGDVVARGHLYFEQFERNEKIWADRMEYNTETEKGKFFDVRGTTAPRIDTRPGMLTSTNPYYFEGNWAERIETKYILHDGYLTNCKVPNPWWRLTGPRFDVVPRESAKAYKSVFFLRKMPLFFTPFFYKSLEKVPRRSGFLTPNIGHSSNRGFMLGAGFFWAPSRSYDATYHFQDYTARGYAHHLELRGKPTDKSDFDALIFGVQDRGFVQSGTLVKQGGLTASVAGRAELGDGFEARGNINYLSSFTFRNAFSDSFNEAVFTNVTSVAFIKKDWSTFAFDTAIERQQDFQSAEIMTPVNPVTGKSTTESNAVIIRKLPEVDLSSRDHQVAPNLPFWYSFQSSAGMFSRSEPYFDANDNLIDRYQTDYLTSRMNLAPEVTTAFHLGELHIVPSFSLDETFYGQSQTPYQTQPGAACNCDFFHVANTTILLSARNFKLDIIPPSFERIFEKKTRFADKLKHVIEPRIYYQYISGIGQDFNRVIRFDKVDLLSNTNQLVFSLTNRLYAKRGNDVQEVFSWEIAQAHYFDPTFGGALLPGLRNEVLSQLELTPFTFLDTPRNYSPVVSILRGSPRPGISFEWRADYDPLRNGIVDSSASADFRKGVYFFSVGQNEVHSNPILIPPENQFRASFGIGNQTRRGWNAGFIGIYDYRQGIIQYAIVQATYNTDCCGFSVQFRRFDFGARNENQYRFAFAVANLGSFGNLRRQERLF